MQYLYVAIAAVTLLKDSFKGLFDSKEFKTIIVLVVVYYIYQQQKLKEAAAEYDKPGNPIGQLARRLHKALHPYLPAKLPVIGYLDDGTDESEVKAVALEIGKLNALDKLTEAYQAIFGDNLNEALSNDDVSEDFDTAYKLGLAGKTPTTGGNILVTPVPSTGASIINASGIKVEVGKSYQAKSGVNLRDYKSPYSVQDKTKAGEVYRVQRLRKNMIIGGTPYVVADVNYMQDAGLFYIPSPFTYMIIANALIAKVEV